ncbi:MAG: YsnF/AvaK domain-containing protein [Candidatus Elarobacter sp.]
MDTLAATTPARFTDREIAGAAVVELVRLGTPPQRLRVAMRDARAQQTFAQRYAIGELSHPHAGRSALSAALGRITATEADEPVSFARELVDSDVPADRAAALDRALGEGDVLLVVPPEAPAAALGVLVRHHADLGSGVVQRVIPLREERLVLRKHDVAEGEVTVRTDVISEVRTFEVPVEREEFVIERRRFAADGTAGGVEVTRIPLRHEEVVVTKHTVVTEEVEVRKERFVEVANISETVRHEELRVDADPGAVVRYGPGTTAAGTGTLDGATLRSEPGARSF